MKIIFLISAWLIAVQAAPQLFSIDSQLHKEWKTYKLKFNKKYDSLNELRRRIIWEDNLKYIQQHNLEYDLGKHSYTLAVNRFADMTTEEFNTRYLTKKSIRKNTTGHTFIPRRNINYLPRSVDWRKQGYVTPVKNQDQDKHCGSCYAFSTTGALEGQYFRKTKKLVSFSEQQIVDCSKKFGNNGCHGGFKSSSLEYIEKYGIEAETSYSYESEEGECRYNKTKVVLKSKGYKYIRSRDEKSLAQAVAYIGPISVAIDASHRSFNKYSGNGIYNELNCDPDDLNHSVLVVGYGSTNGKNFWIVKNSWGTEWGRDGYILMTKDKHNQCGIATDALYPLI